VAEGYLYDQTEAKASAVQRDYDWLTARLHDLRVDLALHEGQVETIRQKFNLPETGSESGSSIDQQSVTELNTQLLQTEADVAARQARYETAEHLRKTGGDLGSLSEAASSRIIEDLRKQQNDLRWKLGDLSSRYTTAYPELIETQQHLQAVNSAIDGETARVLAGLHDEYESAVARQQAASERLAQVTKENDRGEKADGRIQLRDAQRTVDADRSLYNTFLGKLQDVEQQLTRHDPEARIISSASLPDAPSFPKPIIFIGGGAVFGGMVGTGLALLIPRREKGFSSINDAETKLSLPVRGALPMLSRPSQIARRVPMNIVDYVMGRSLSQFTECLRALRISLRIGSADGPHIIQITSAVAGEGKSSVAAALAVSAALSGLRTALIDADIRSPSISGMFGLWDVQGLTNVLQDNLPVRVAIQRHRGLPLSIIAAGSVACPDLDLIASQLFASIVKDLARDHDLVILDTPPVLAVSDPLVVAKVSEETLLVIDSQRTPNVMVDRAVKALRAVNAPLAGLVLNKVNLTKPGRYSYGYGTYGVYGPTAKKLTARRA
jgi:capsular exopolysaccharide synthesis family protein